MTREPVKVRVAVGRADAEAVIGREAEVGRVVVEIGRVAGDLAAEAAAGAAVTDFAGAPSFLMRCCFRRMS